MKQVGCKERRVGEVIVIVMGKLSQDAKPSGGCESSEGGKKGKMGKMEG
jgi:hypothetical protein